MMSFGSGFPSCASTDAFRFRAAWPVREPFAQPGQCDVEVGDGQALGALVGHAAVPAVSPDAANDDGHVHHPVHPLVLEEVLPELGQLVVPVGLEAAEQLFGAAPEHDVIVGALADEGLVAVVLPAGGWPADQLVVGSPFGRLSIA